MCSLRFENNLLTDGRVRFASKIISFLSNVFPSGRKIFFFSIMCLLRFENNLFTIEGLRFAWMLKKTSLSKLSFAFVSLALPLLVVTMAISKIDGSKINFYETSITFIDVHCTVSRISSSSSSLLFPGEISFPLWR